jgi:hypothetical protein
MPGQTPVGDYRFVIDGRRRTGAPAAEQAYHLESAEFTVSPWGGITVEAATVGSDGSVSFKVGPTSTHTFGTPRTYVVGPIDYPDTYVSPFAHVRNDRRLFTYGLSDPGRHQQYCPECTFRPWADTSAVSIATVRVERADGRRDDVIATFAAGRWSAPTALGPDDAAYVEVGGIVDTYGETNGKRYVLAGTPTDPVPTPVVPEAPAVVLLPLVGLVVLGALHRRRNRRGPIAGEAR